MPYVKRKKYSRSSRPGYGRCAKMVYSDASKALTIAKGLHRLLNVEIKNFDVQQTGVSVSQTAVIIQLTNIPQGDTTVTRDGNQAKMLGVDLNYTITVNDTPTIPRHLIRIMLVVDKQTNQAIYAIGDLLEDSTGLDNLVSPRNLNNKHRFTILYDRLHNLSIAFSVAHVRKYIKKEVLLRYDASTPSIADLTQNSLSLVQISNGTVNLPTITSFNRVRYVDN